VFVQGGDLFLIHLHLEHPDLVLKFFKSDSLAGVSVHHLEDGAKTQVASMHVVFNLLEGTLQDLAIIGVAGVSKSNVGRLLSSTGRFIVATQPMRGL